MPFIRTGKNTPTIKLEIHKKNTAIPIPIPRNRTGNISASINHTIGPIAPWKKAKYTTVMDNTTYGNVGDPLSIRVEIPIVISATVTPVKPVSIIGLLFTLFSRDIPTITATTAINPFATFAIKAVFVPKPEFSRICVP
ncbi:hypothetical protein SRABI84_05414 [Peribacillus simplex]|nr:hypothetical protein SRABI84_05414 [Peribacillus simplex]